MEFEWVFVQEAAEQADRDRIDEVPPGARNDQLLVPRQNLCRFGVRYVR